MKTLEINTFSVYIATEPRPSNKMKHTDPIIQIIQSQNGIEMNTPFRFRKVKNLLIKSILNN